MWRTSLGFEVLSPLGHKAVKAYGRSRAANHDVDRWGGFPTYEACDNVEHPVPERQPLEREREIIQGFGAPNKAAPSRIPVIPCERLYAMTIASGLFVHQPGRLEDENGLVNFTKLAAITAPIKIKFNSRPENIFVDWVCAERVASWNIIGPTPSSGTVYFEFLFPRGYRPPRMFKRQCSDRANQNTLIIVAKLRCSLPRLGRIASIHGLASISPIAALKPIRSDES
ncbi:hypothetical protein BD779DRAFT_1476169 [Infundibulicybe gibba]|nr:hypothetical protein BD779DRAFT_1476169 [Infundibulicybe gibba]